MALCLPLCNSNMLDGIVSFPFAVFSSTSLVNIARVIALLDEVSHQTPSSNTIVIHPRNPHFSIPSTSSGTTLEPLYLSEPACIASRALSQQVACSAPEQHKKASMSCMKRVLSRSLLHIISS